MADQERTACLSKKGRYSMKNKTAQWIRRTHIFRRDEYECSACGEIADKPYKICPCCGRHMKGGKYDPSWVDELEIIDSLFDD